jgi:hypothetical protein
MVQQKSKQKEKKETPVQINNARYVGIAMQRPRKADITVTGKRDRGARGRGMDAASPYILCIVISPTPATVGWMWTEERNSREVSCRVSRFMAIRRAVDRLGVFRGITMSSCQNLFPSPPSLSLPWIHPLTFLSFD